MYITRSATTNNIGLGFKCYIFTEVWYFIQNQLFIIHLNDGHMYIGELRLKYVKKKKKFSIAKEFDPCRARLVSGSVYFPCFKFIWLVLRIFMLQLAFFFEN